MQRPSSLTLTAAVAVALAAISLAAPSSAVVMTATYTGTVASGDDNHGTFFGGAHSSHFAGDEAFTAVFIYDTALGIHTGDGILDDRIRGGIGAPGGGPSPMLSASLTIKGLTIDLPVGFDDSVRAQSEAFFLGFRPGLVTHTSDFRTSIPDLDRQYTLSVGAFIPTPASVEATHDLDIDLGGSFFLIDQSRLTPSIGPADGSHAISAYGQLRATHLRVESAAAAVPEPAQWSLMILGFAASGALLRRRRGAPAHPIG
ncbi:PEPxxWA-CTERM sorting domain-containing protein [uncultured Phenylobacterium sp.]|uniref:PEPxxWA-CTERM sorting domain-containing protein n=1 Tax=uncultured Phenylobacterium sp. TaxID=349273 RepID=UPI0025CF270E|nr:PEPxxWA-CTERM sorting domain-containing protein [uncultured Phenylobacterium sp.]